MILIVKQIVLFDRLYNNRSNQNSKDLISRYQKYVLELTQGFPNTKIIFNKVRKFDQRVEITISGPEDVFIVNMLKKEIGTIQEFKNLSIDMRLKGNLVDVGKVGFGLFVDCGILNPKTDVFISLHTLRDQLCNFKEKSLPEIIKAYDFINEFPVHVKINKIDNEKENVQGELDIPTLNFFKKVLDEDLEAVYVSGETKGQLKKALIRTGHLRDIVSIYRHNFIDNIVLLSDNTEAPGIIADIGKYLRNCKLNAIRPSRIRELCY